MNTFERYIILCTDPTPEGKYISFQDYPFFTDSLDKVRIFTAHGAKMFLRGFVKHFGEEKVKELYEIKKVLITIVEEEE